MASSYRQFADETKELAVARVEAGETVAAVARAMGLPDSATRRWVRKAEVAAGTRPSGGQCALAGCEIPVPDARTRWCSPTHAYAARRKPRGRTPLAAVIDDEVSRIGSERLLAERIGISAATLSRNRLGGGVTEESLQKYSAYFGERMPLVASETERRRAWARSDPAAARGRELTTSAAALAKRSETNSDRTSTRRLKAAEKRSKSLKDWHGQQKATDPEYWKTKFGDHTGKLQAGRNSPRRRALISLGRRLRYRDDNPDVATLMAWANEYARSVDASAEDVLRWWKAKLKVPMRGRPVNLKLLKELTETRTHWAGQHGMKANGNLADGWSRYAAQELRMSERAVKDAYIRYKKRGLL